jgi:hypothetical protein
LLFCFHVPVFPFTRTKEYCNDEIVSNGLTGHRAACRRVVACRRVGVSACRRIAASCLRIEARSAGKILA